MAASDLGIHELETATGVPALTLRHWVKKGVLPRPRGRGRVARYLEGIWFARKQSSICEQAKSQSVKSIDVSLCSGTTT